MADDLIRTASSVAPHIDIVSMYQEDVDRTETALQRLNSKPVGRSLLNELKNLSTNGRGVEIHVHDSFKSRTIPFLTQSQIKKYNVEEQQSEESNDIASLISKKKGFLRKGTGVSAVVDFNPKDSVRVDENGRHLFYKDEKDGFVMLGHELIHAMRFMKGVHVSDFKGGKEGQGHASEVEERRVIGFGEFSDKAISENKIRKEHHITPRTSHDADYDYERAFWESELIARRLDI